MMILDVHVTPSITALPGSQVLQQLANGLAAWALVGSLIALVIGAVVWALGSHSQNMHQSVTGRRAVITAIGAAVLLGGAPSIINFFFHVGTSVR